MRADERATGMVLFWERPGRPGFCPAIARALLRDDKGSQGQGWQRQKQQPRGDRPGPPPWLNRRRCDAIKRRNARHARQGTAIQAREAADQQSSSGKDVGV